MTNEKKKQFRSLTRTITVAFLATSLATLLLASGLQLYFAIRTQQQLIFSQQLLSAEDAAKTVRSFIEGKFSILRTTASLSSHETDQPEAQQIALNKLLILEPSFRQIAIEGNDGQELISSSRLSRFASGQFHTLIGPKALTTLKQKGVYVSPVYIEETTSEPMVLLAVPINDLFGNSNRILAAEVNLKFMWTLVEEIKVGQHGLAYVVNKNGDLLAFADTSRVLRGENVRTLSEVSEFIQGESDQAEAAVVTSRGILGTSVIATHLSLGLPDWAVVIEIPTTEAYAVVVQGIFRSLIIIVGSVLLVIAVSLYFSMRIITPIKKLRDATEELGKGNFNVLVPIESENEIGEVARTFNTMAKQIREYSENMEEKVQQRSEELREKMVELEQINKFMINREIKMVELKEEIERLKGGSVK